MNYKQQRELLLTQQRREQQWSARQAQRQMDFQERMSSTAHQREVEDLKKAGLNPVLSATGGAGAATGSGAMAEQSSIIPELAELLRASHSGGSGGSTKVIVEQPETPSSYFTARQMKQGYNAGQGAYHGAANSVKAVKKDLDSARSELWDSIKNVNFSLRPKSKFSPVGINGSGEDIHNIYDAVRHYNRAVKNASSLGMHNHIAAERYDREFKVWFKKIRSSLDPDQVKMIQDLIYN